MVINKENNKTIKLAVDTMGADKGTEVIIRGADILASKHIIKFIFVGDKNIIQPMLLKTNNIGNSEIIHTSDFVKSNEKGSEALRGGKSTSMWMSLNLVKEGKADAIVSAGNSGALLAMSYISLRPIKGVSRPAMIAYFPTKTGQTAMLDLGANIECNSKNLIDFAIMGSAFSRIILKINNPTVGLLNVGEENQKGNLILQEASSEISKQSSNVNYFGFVEGDDITEGKVDVIVTDGFSGNIALKTAEGTAKFVTHLLEESFKSSLLSKIGYLLARKSLRNMRKKVDPRRYNGAVMLGLNGIVVKSHGSTDAKGFSNALLVAYEMVKGDFINDLKKKILNKI